MSSMSAMIHHRALPDKSIGEPAHGDGYVPVATSVRFLTDS
jgi:hypothetical protein